MNTSMKEELWWSTTITQMQQLLQNCFIKKTHLIGMLRKNSKGIPKKVLKLTPPLKTGDVICQERDGIVAGCWKDKREVRLLTTKH